MTNQDANDFTVSELGPAYETIDDVRAAASTAANPIYANATHVSPHTASAVPLPQQGVPLNSNEESVYEEIDQIPGVRLWSAVSVSSDHEQTLLLTRNESYGLIAASSTSPHIYISPSTHLTPVCH